MVPVPSQRILRILERAQRQENLVLCGSWGSGKTVFLEALGQQAVEGGFKVS